VAPWKAEYAQNLSEADIQELRRLMEEESGAPVTMRQAFDFGCSLLRWARWTPTQLRPDQVADIKTVARHFEKKSPVKQSLPELSNQETNAFVFIRRALRDGHSPSVREVCRELGFRSSRSGLRLVNKLMAKGLVFRGKDGQLRSH